MVTDIVVLSLGSNHSNRVYNLRTAIKMIPLRLKKCSRLYESKALLKEGSPDWWNLPFLNMIISGYTKLCLQAMLDCIHKIERSLKRNSRRESWSPRTIDIDIIFWKNEIIETQILTIPHKEMHVRDFVLKPTCDIMPAFIHPNLHLSVKNLLKKLNNQLNHYNNCKHITEIKSLLNT